MPDENLYNEFEEYDFLPELPELCERNLASVKHEVAYIFTLYGLALGYLGGVHPAKAWLVLGKELVEGMADITPKEWENLTIAIADKLQERQMNGSS